MITPRIPKLFKHVKNLLVILLISSKSKKHLSKYILTYLFYPIMNIFLSYYVHISIHMNVKTSYHE